jgi:hypothetical protein
VDCSRDSEHSVHLFTMAWHGMLIEVKVQKIRADCYAEPDILADFCMNELHAHLILCHSALSTRRGHAAVSVNTPY